MMVPFLKWPGGKRWFVTKHASLLPANYVRYIEPFLGSGCVFFHICPEQALLGDINKDLITCYLALQDDPYAVEVILERHELNHCEKYYYAVRASRPRSLPAKAAQFIYLNRTCFNGIYRVSLNGTFNVPKGTKDTVIFDDDDFEAIAAALQHAEIRPADFEELIDEARVGDFIFADPPYIASHSNNGFVKYNEKLFSWKDQIRLSKALTRARDRGVKILLTNASHDSVRRLYQNSGFTLTTASRFSSISARAESRRQFEELIVMAT